MRAPLVVLTLAALALASGARDGTCRGQQVLPPPGAAPAGAGAGAGTAGSATRLVVTPELLVERRDLWPARVTLLAPQAFEEGESLAAGAEAWLLEFSADEVRLDSGSFLFRCPAAETDVLQRAQALAASLTPEQLGLTWRAARGRPELWPLRVTLTAGVELADGTVYAPGDEVVLRGVEGDELSVVAPGADFFFSVEALGTDVMARARERLALPEADREPFFTRSVAAALAAEPAGGVSLAEADLVLVYVGRRGCTRCAAFTPALRAAMERLSSGAARAPEAERAPRVALVSLARDRKAAEARAWVAEAGLPGRAVAWERRLQAATLDTLPIDVLPGLFVFDRAGTLLERSHPGGGSPTVQEVLARLEQR